MERLDPLHAGIVDLTEAFVSQRILTETLDRGHHLAEIRPVNILLVAQSVDAAPYHQYQDQNPGQKDRAKKSPKRTKLRVLPNTSGRELTTKNGYTEPMMPTANNHAPSSGQHLHGTILRETPIDLGDGI